MARGASAESSSVRIDFESLRQEMDHFLGVAMALARADAASVILTSGGTGRVIAHKNLDVGNASFPWSWEDAPFKPNAFVVQRSVESVVLMRTLALVTGRSKVKSFIRKSIVVEDKYAVAMQLFSFEKTMHPSDGDLKLFDAIAKQMKVVLQPIIKSFLATGSLVTIAASQQEMIDATIRSQGIRALFDDKLRYIATSASWASPIQTTQESLIGTQYQHAQKHFTDIMRQLGRRALETGHSVPELEFSSTRGGVTRHFTLYCSPIRPIDGTADWLDAYIKENAVGNEYLAEANFAESAPKDFERRGDSTQQFLLETLLRKRAIRLRDAVSYITVRSWRESIKKHQITAFKACKKTEASTLAIAAGFECAEEVIKLVGASAFKFVVPVPCGHSPQEKCLSFSIAKAAAVRLGIPVIQAFAHLEQKGTSHPKTNLKRDKMVQIRDVPGPAILIDDVATSGVHLSEASKILEANGTDSLAIAWIGGESDE
jgi:hypothetical protein